MSNEALLRPVIAQLPRGASVLDLGSGNGGTRPTGRPARYARALGSAGFAVTAVDQQPGIGLPWAGVEYVQTSIEDFLKVNRRQYHLVICSNVLQFVDPAVITDLPKLVATDGSLFVRTFASEPIVLKALNHIAGLALADQRAYRVSDDHPPEGPHTHDVIEMVFRGKNR